MKPIMIWECSSLAVVLCTAILMNGRPCLGQSSLGLFPLLQQSPQGTETCFRLKSAMQCWLTMHW